MAVATSVSSRENADWRERMRLLRISEPAAGLHRSPGKFAKRSRASCISPINNDGNFPGHFRSDFPPTLICCGFMLGQGGGAISPQNKVFGVTAGKNFFGCFQI